MFFGLIERIPHYNLILTTNTLLAKALYQKISRFWVIKDLQNKLDEKKEMVSRKTEPARNFVRGDDEGLANKRLHTLLFGNVVLREGVYAKPQLPNFVLIGNQL